VGADGDEKYPPSATTTPVKPTDPPKLPDTGNSGTDSMLVVGGATVLAGGLLVAATARRRRAAV
jgi:LPXTG-motif cell wall-anchored protein